MTSCLPVNGLIGISVFYLSPVATNYYFSSLQKAIFNRHIDTVALSVQMTDMWCHIQTVTVLNSCTRRHSHSESRHIKVKRYTASLSKLEPSVCTRASNLHVLI